MPIQSTFVRPLSVERFSTIALGRLERLVERMRETVEVEGSDGFRKQQPSPLLRYRPRAEIAQDVRAACRSLAEAFPAAEERWAALGEPWMRLVDRVAGVLAESNNGLHAAGAYYEVVRLEDVVSGRASEAASDTFKVVAEPSAVYLQANALEERISPEMQDTLSRDEGDSVLLGSAVHIAQRLRADDREPAPSERAILDWAYALLDQGRTLPTRFRPLGMTGFREHQTYLSLADPGPGHLAVTVRQGRLMRGTVIHVEHIDRDGVDDKEKIEAYRLPAARNAARVRLHAGDEAPVTAYIGRPVFENHRLEPRRLGDEEGREAFAGAEEFRWDILKSAHMTAASCTAMFVNGVADCKIAIERMSARQALAFMRAVSGNVLRDRHRQYLSAAFNINTPFVDDRAEGTPVLVTEQLAIARLGVELAADGGFEKVTWDGASNDVPSVPLTSQLGHEGLLEVVHLAHERGLETYISAGMKAEHMKNACYAGVDGVGIGTSLHHRDPETGLMGALMPEAIAGVLDVRDEAARSTLGRAAKLLARLDRMHFEGSLDAGSEPLRSALFDALAKMDEGACTELGDQLAAVRSLPDTTVEHPLVAAAQRILATETVTPSAGDFEPAERSRGLHDLEERLRSTDLDTLEEALAAWRRA